MIGNYGVHTFAVSKDDSNGSKLAATCNGLNYVDKIRQGNMEIEIVFDGDTNEKTKFIIINIYDSRISINSLMRIDKNYTS